MPKSKIVISASLIQREQKISIYPNYTWAGRIQESVVNQNTKSQCRCSVDVLVAKSLIPSLFRWCLFSSIGGTLLIRWYHVSVRSRSIVVRLLIVAPMACCGPLVSVASGIVVPAVSFSPKHVNNSSSNRSGRNQNVEFTIVENWSK